MGEITSTINLWFLTGLISLLIASSIITIQLFFGRATEQASLNKINQQDTNYIFLLLQNLYNIFEFIGKNNPNKVKFLIFGLIAFVFINPFWFLNENQIKKILQQEKFNFKILAFLFGSLVSLLPLSAVFGGLPDRRSFYYYDFFFYLSAILIIIKLSFKIKSYVFKEIPELKNLSNVFGIFFYFYLIFQANHFFKQEIQFSKFVYSQYEQRHNFLKSNYGKTNITFFVPPLRVNRTDETPRFLYYRDLYSGQHWVNSCISSYYRVKYVYSVLLTL